MSLVEIDSQRMLEPMLHRSLRSSAMLTILGIVLATAMVGSGWRFVLIYLLPIAVLILFGFFRWRKAHVAWTARNACSVCGYPHKGLPPGAKCPECGTPRTNA